MRTYEQNAALLRQLLEQYKTKITRHDAGNRFQIVSGSATASVQRGAAQPQQRAVRLR